MSATCPRVELGAALRATGAVRGRTRSRRSSSAPTRSRARSTRSRSGSTTAPGARPRRPTPRWRAARAARCAACPLTIKDSHWLAGVTSAVGSRALGRLRPERDLRGGRAARGRGRRHLRQDHNAGVLLLRHHRVAAQRPHEQPVERVAHARRLLRRRRGGARGRRRPAGAGRRRRRLDPHPGRVLRRRRLQADVRAVPREPCSPGWKTLVGYGPMARTRRRRAGRCSWRSPARRARPPQPDVSGLDAPAPDPARRCGSRSPRISASPPSTTMCGGPSEPPSPLPGVGRRRRSSRTRRA